MSATGEFYEGQAVVIVGQDGRPEEGREDVTVAAVKRTFVHVRNRWGNIAKFRIEDGWESNGFLHRRLWTPEALDVEDRRVDAVRRLRAQDVLVRSVGRLTVEQLEAMVAIVEPPLTDLAVTL